MMNGEEGLKFSKNVLKLQRLPVTSPGRRHMQSSLDYVKSLAHGLTAEPTSRFTLKGADCLSRKSTRQSERVTELRHVHALSHFSMSECTELDKRGIKILGAEYEYDFNCKEWANGQEIY